MERLDGLELITKKTFSPISIYRFSTFFHSSHIHYVFSRVKTLKPNHQSTVQSDANHNKTDE